MPNIGFAYSLPILGLVSGSVGEWGDEPPSSSATRNRINGALEENHRKCFRHLRLHFVGHLYGKFMEIIGLESPWNYSASIWNNKIQIFIIGEPKSPHFHDLGICGPVTKPQSQLCLTLETPGLLKKIKKSPTHLLNVIFINLEILDFKVLVNLGKDGR